MLPGASQSVNQASDYVYWCLMIVEWFNRITVYNKAVLHDAVDKRRKDQALVTVSNHRSCFDDPVIWGNSLHYVVVYIFMLIYHKSFVFSISL